MCPINLMEFRSTYTTGGGPDKTILLSAEKHNPLVVKVVLVYLRGINDRKFQITNWAKSKNINIIEVLERGKIDFNALAEVNRIIEENKIEIIHSHDYKTDILAYLLKFKNRNLKLLSTAHGWTMDDNKMKFYKWLNLKFLKRFDKIIAVSNATKEIMIKEGIKPQKIEVIHNAIDINDWKYDPNINSLRKELGINEEEFVVGAVGRLSYEKDIVTLLKVASLILSKKKNVKFLIVGEGAERKNLENLSKELKLSEYVIFTGFYKDIKRVYKTIDLLVLTSLTEGLPNTVLEAQALEVPVISTDVGGIKEIIEDKVNGLLFKPRDVEGIAEGILSILNDKDLSTRLSKKGREIICKRFSFDKRLQKIENLYLTLSSS